MILGRVVGEAVSTVKDAPHEGAKALLVQPIELDGSDRGVPVVALDAVDAGAGDRVLVVMDGFAASTAVGRARASIDMAVVGIVDRIDLLS